MGVVDAFGQNAQFPGFAMRLQKGFGPIVCLGSVERQVFLAAKGDSVTIVAFLTALFATIETVVHVAMTIVITNVHYSFFFFFFSYLFFSILFFTWIGLDQDKKLEHTKETAKQSSFWTLLLYSISKISLVFRIQGCVLFWPLAKTVFAVLYIISRVFVLLSIFALADLTLFFSLCCICFAQ